MTDGEVLLVADYLLGVLGVAMMRTCLRTPSVAVPRRVDMQHVLDHLDEVPQALRLPLHVHDVESGYASWAPVYDGPNPAVESEEPVVRALIADAPRGRALDAACGTGRHAVHLVALGYDVVGVDTTEAMLDLARAKVPGADFRRGRLEALPVDDASVDLVTCALALEHVDDLAIVMREIARVLRPGGWLVCSDTHPIMRALGLGAFVPRAGALDLQLVRGHVQHVHEYFDAFEGAGLDVRRCLEPPVTDAVLASFPSHAFFPDGTRQAFLGLPFLLVWQAEKLPRTRMRST